MEMLDYLCKKNAYVLTNDAKEEVEKIITTCVDNKDGKFANGRLVRNMFEAMKMNHARRVYKISSPERNELMNITLDDVSFD